MSTIQLLMNGIKTPIYERGRLSAGMEPVLLPSYCLRCVDTELPSRAVLKLSTDDLYSPGE